MNSLQPFLLGNIDVCGVPGKSYMNTRFFYRKRNRMYFCSIVFKKKMKGDFYHEYEKCKSSVSEGSGKCIFKTWQSVCR